MTTAYLIGLAIATILILIVYIFIDKMKSKSQMKFIFSLLLVCLLICCIGLILQIVFSNFYTINPIYFDYFVYIGTCFLPVFFLLFSIAFKKTKFKFNKKYLLLFIIPTLSLILLWTNNSHHLFYEKYSTNPQDTIFGKYFYVHYIYSNILYVISLFNLIVYSIKNSGFFTKQAFLILLGSLVPIIANLLAFLGIITMDIYLTPITFALAALFVAFAIFKFDFLKIAPIALQLIVDRMSDAYIVVNETNIVTDFNLAFLDIFNLKGTDIRNKELKELFAKHSKTFGVASNLLLDAINKAKYSTNTIILENELPSINKYFHIEVNSITNKGNFLGTLILLKDITQHTLDMQTIQDNQDMLIEKERLASLGQMIGGIAHNLKTPIMSISGAAEGLSDLIKEYDSSIEDPDVNFKDHHEIASDMNEWIGKIKTHLSYMSDIITAIKGQAVNFADQSSSAFSIRELINYVDILMKHELKNALINLKTQADIDTSTILNGNINSLVQVINNIISNAIQAYQAQGKTNYDINFNIYKEDSNIIFKIEDFAGGLPDKVTKKLFKEMVTTKRKKRNRTWFIYVLFKYKSSF